MDLSPDEQRLIEENRATAASQSRPVEVNDAVPPTRAAIAALVNLAIALEPKAEVWLEVRHLLLRHKAWQP